MFDCGLGEKNSLGFGFINNKISRRGDIYELDKLWMTHDNKDNLDILRDNNQLQGYTHVIFIDLHKINDNIYYNKLTIEDYNPVNNNKYLYKKVSSGNTPNLTPTALITKPEKTFNKKICKWFEQNKDKHELINTIHETIEENKDTIINELKDKFPKKAKYILAIRVNKESTPNILRITKYSMRY